MMSLLKTLNNRSQYYGYVNNYLRNSDMKYICLDKIGSKSKNASVYLCKGTVGIGRMLKWVYKKYGKYAMKDINLSVRLSSLVLRGINPHFNIVYRMQRDQMLCEAAAGDLKTFLLGSDVRYDVMLNCLQQIIICILSFHVHCELVHTDCYLGNFLYHQIVPGGWIHYLVDGKDIYIENLGYLWMINDFDLVTEPDTADDTYKQDYLVVLEALGIYKKDKKFGEKLKDVMETVDAVSNDTMDVYEIIHMLLDNTDLFVSTCQPQEIINNVYIL